MSKYYMKVYLLEAEFQDADFRNYDKILGIYNTLELAEFHQRKCTQFFKAKYAELFEPLLKDEMFDEDGDFIDSRIEEEFYKNKSKYREISEFRLVKITEIELNTDWSKSEFFEDNPNLSSIAKEFNRQWNLDNIL